MLTKWHFLIISLIAISFVTITNIQAQDYNIPQWIKNNALWWSDGQIDDSSFLTGIEYLMEQGIMKVPSKSSASQATLPFVPNWIKDTAGWWATGKLTDSDFVNGIRWLVENGIIQVSTASPAACSGAAQCIVGTIQRVVDGDTLYIENHRIRLSLTNTPEVYEPGFNQATQFTKQLCPVGSKVVVDQDDLQLFDSYNRLLGKVYCDGKNLNEELLKAGHAWILTEYCKQSEFEAEDWAQSYGCADKKTQQYTPQSDPPKYVPPKEEPKPESAEPSCDPHYPDVCIPPYPPDLDCGEIPYRDFTVLQPDPHRFDGDKDGIGCES